MRAFTLEIDPDDGSCVITFIFDNAHVCHQFDGDEFDAFAEMVSKANLESKVARS